MNKIPTAIIFAILALAVMSCGLFDKLAGGGPDLQKTDELWSDVPRMDGLSPSDMELPLAIKVLMRTVLNNLWRVNKEGEDKTPVSGDWIVFTTSGTPADVQSFYTNERMASFGNWELGKNSTCLDGKDKGVNGVLCVFQKTADKKQVELAIIAMQDDKTKQTNVFYLRLEKDAESPAGNTSTNPRRD
jgi:hypothetical protein